MAEEQRHQDLRDPSRPWRMTKAVAIPGRGQTLPYLPALRTSVEGQGRD